MSVIIPRIWHQLALIKRLATNVWLNGYEYEFFRNKEIEIENVRKSEVALQRSGNLKIERKDSTSISDSNLYSDYSSFCKLASNNENVFEYFRAHPAYKNVLEHVPHHIGIIYARRLAKSNQLQSFRSIAKAIDHWGSPWQFHYKKFGKVYQRHFVMCTLQNL